MVESAGEERGIREGSAEEAAFEREVQSADDLDGRGRHRIRFGVRTAAADNADRLALGGEVTGEIGQELAGGSRVGVEKLVEEEDTHGWRTDPEHSTKCLSSKSNSSRTAG